MQMYTFTQFYSDFDIFFPSSMADQTIFNLNSDSKMNYIFGIFGKIMLVSLWGGGLDVVLNIVEIKAINS